ncbi:probable RNA-directed DNA polymerase from transposon X-element [Trichonephila clavipes]|nr:probable RNA-directed DNA polymerase from transposon X-element [Trichonephila clavipes]
MAGVVLRSSLKEIFLIFMSPPPPLRTGVEATLVALTPNDQEPFMVASIYIPPNPNYRNLSADLDTLFKIFNTAIVAGDYNAKHTSWGCGSSDPRVANSTQEIDDQVSNLTTEILNAHASASRPFYQTERPYVQGELKGLIKDRNKARKTWQQTRHPQHKTELNRLQNIIKRKIYHYRQQAWEDNLLTLNAEDNSLWGIAKAFRKKASPISALNGPTGIALSDTNKTEVIAQSLESQFQLNDIHNPHKDEVITSVVDAYLDSNANNIDLIPPTLPSEIIQIIKKIKIKKCPGRDGITNKMIKKLPKLTIFKITNIVNNMLTLRYFPKSWKTAVVVPILKPGKNSALAESYRPISLLPVLSKLAEKIILARLNDYLEREKILIPEQHGFRPRLSTSHQLLRVVEFIKEGNNNDECTAAVFLDIQKAFDRVKVEGYLVRGITQCFNCNNFYHTAANCFMKPRCLKCGKDHATRNCHIKERQENPFCINCQDFGHSACYTKCPKFPQLQKRRCLFPTRLKEKIFQANGLKREFPSLTLLAEKSPIRSPRNRKPNCK